MTTSTNNNFISMTNLISPKPVNSQNNKMNGQHTSISAQSSASSSTSSSSSVSNSSLNSCNMASWIPHGNLKQRVNLKYF